MSVLDNFQEWKSFLSQKVDQAKNLGMEQNTISDLAYQLGDYLAKDIDPQNEQERLLKELWSVADENEQRTIAGLMVKLVDDGRK
jgi:cell shape-determining protein MreC